jgi:acyl carrier protein
LRGALPLRLVRRRASPFLYHFRNIRFCRWIYKLSQDLGKERQLAFMEEVLTKVQSAFHSAFNIDPNTVTLETTPDQVPAWDSMGHVTLASSIEQAFGLSFDVDDLMEMENVQEICRVVKAKLAKVQDAKKS